MKDEPKIAVIYYNDYRDVYYVSVLVGFQETCEYGPFQALRDARRALNAKGLRWRKPNSDASPDVVCVAKLN